MNKRSFGNFFQDPQNIIALGVTFVSICALVVSIMQTSIMQEERLLMREYARASVWPRLEMGHVKSHSRKDGSVTQFELYLTNSGIGPAIVTDVRVHYKEQPVKNWWELFESFDLADSIRTYCYNASFNQSIIKIDEERMVLSLTDNLPLAQVFYENYELIIFEIYYESIYGEKWKLVMKGSENETFEINSEEGVPEAEQFEN